MQHASGRGWFGMLRRKLERLSAWIVGAALVILGASYTQFGQHLGDAAWQGATWALCETFGWSCPQPLTPAQLVEWKARIRDGLIQQRDSKPDIAARRMAIDDVKALSGMHLADHDIQDLIQDLATYIRNNIDLRRTPEFKQVGEQADIHRPEDIIEALVALQALRQASRRRMHVNLGGIDFSRMNLEDLDLAGFYFGHASFAGSQLSDCRCEGADFRHAKFPGTAIWGTRREREQPANFRNTRFERADLTGSKWAYVDFHGSTIHEAAGRDAVIVFCDIVGLTEEQRAVFARALAACPK